MTSGDFNGDGKDDIAISTWAGEVFIYYGPICGYDNSITAMANAIGSSNANENSPQPVTATNATACTVMDLSHATASAPALYQATQKLLGPQATYVSALSLSAGVTGMGSLLLSRRPTRNSSGVVLSNPGNIDGDPDGTSDLIVGTSAATDPNVAILSSKQSGLAYIMFGHKAGGTTFPKTTGGLHFGTPSYYSSIDTTGSGSNVYNYYNPVILQPYTSDLSLARFFYYEVNIGDLNGDGRGDILMNTDDVQTANDGSTPVIFGGGFKLFY